MTAAVLLGTGTVGAAAAVPPPVVTFSAPAGALATGHLRGMTYDAVLPSGRLVTPAGTSAVVGMGALGVALTPDGRYAIVSNGAERGGHVRSGVDPQTAGGSSLAVVDVASMTVVDRYRAADESFYAGVAALADPQDPARVLVLASGGGTHAVYAFTLDAGGHLSRDRTHVIPIPGRTDQAFADSGLSYPAALLAARDGRHAYVVNELGDGVAELDTERRALVGGLHATGFRPAGVALAGSRLLVTNEGMMRYGVLPAPAEAPPFRIPAADLRRASSLAMLALYPDGNLADENGGVAMDPPPDGLATVGGAHPTGIVTTADGGYAFVAMANVDRVSVVELGAAPHVLGGVELRLFDHGPYGTQPTALALSRDGSRLYVALAGLNAIAVIDARDPAHLHRLGLIPTGWAPNALALAADDRTLFVVNERGFGTDTGFTGDPSVEGDASAVWSTLQRIDLASVRLAETTRATLAATRRVLTSAPRYPKAIRNVVLLLVQGRTFDAALGDLGVGPADPAFVNEPESVTPNLHALARRYALAGNLFADAEDADAGQQCALAGLTSAYTARHLGTVGRGPFARSQDPENELRTGTIFNALARQQLSFRDYGALLRVAGYANGAYTLDAPAAAVLSGHVDASYPGPDPAIPDGRRADEFARDYGSLAPPRFAAVWLAGRDPAEGDRALGAIVSFLSHRPQWRSTAIVVMPIAAEGGRDHVDEHRTFAVVVSPYAKRRFIGQRHLSTAGALKTIDGILGLPALTLGDLLATDMSDFFTSVPDPSPYEALPVAGRS
jgi:DNA-binding beta-propeller fold protein YncE